MLRRARAALPVVEPSVPVLHDQPFDDPTYLFEPKYDGFRRLLYITREGCPFRSKRGNILTQFEELCLWVREELRAKEAILDGEIVALDSEGRQDFLALLARRGNVPYAVFDALWLNGTDLRGLSPVPRKRVLERLLRARRRLCRRSTPSRSTA